MKILVLSFYYAPDLSAGSFRTTALVEQLVKAAPVGAHIDVLTTQPNRYASFNQTVPAHETDGTVSITRFPLPSHKSGMVDQAKAYVSFFRAVRQATRGRHYDLVYATSSRLFTAFLGAIVAKRTRSPLYLDIRDIFVDTIADILPGRISTLGLPVFRAIEHYAIRSAARVNVVSEGFLPYFRERFPAQTYDCYTNGIDDAFLAAPIPEQPTGEARKLVLYAGNIGEGQGLHRILPQLAQACSDYQFLVIGDGGRREVLEIALRETGVNNVTIAPPVRRAELIALYAKADVLFLHLNAYPAFEKVLPSKLFEYAATGKPILAGIAGYSKSFVQSEIDNASVFAPCDAQAGAAALRSLHLGTTPRVGFIEKYKRDNIMTRLAQRLVEMASAPAHR